MEWIEKILQEEFEKQERIVTSTKNETIFENAKMKMNDAEVVLNIIKNLKRFKLRVIAETVNKS